MDLQQALAKLREIVVDLQKLFPNMPPEVIKYMVSNPVRVLAMMDQWDMEIKEKEMRPETNGGTDEDMIQ